MGGLAMRLAATAGNIPLMASATPDRETGKVYRRPSVADVVPEPPGNHHRGPQPWARIAGADR
jgi:hypothetical protein